MNVLSYRPQDLLPGVLFDKENGQFMIFGQSCPENVTDFYAPIFQWIDEYAEDPLRNTVLDFKLTYFNTASAKIFLMIMIKMEELSDLGHQVKIRWFYLEEDEDLKEAGEEYKTIVDIDLELIPLKNDANKQKNEDYFKRLIDDIT